MSGEVKNYRDIMSTRMLEFAIETMKIEKSIKQSYINKHIFGQLFRSVTSAGANFEESVGAQSKSDFIYKTHLVLKELRESNFWLKLLHRSNAGHSEHSNMQLLLTECMELIKIFTSSLVKAKESSPKNK
jgi:four helix bundle protein